MPKARVAKRKKPGRGAKARSSATPRNPFALVLRRRAAGPEPSQRAYRRRAKHANTTREAEPED